MRASASLVQPVAFSNLLALGKHSDGTTYVIDNDLNGDRAFVSEGSVLQRRKVAGSASMGDRNAGEWRVSVHDAPGFRLKVEMSGGVPVRMGVVRNALPDVDFSIGVEGDVLTVVGREAVEGLTLRNLSGAVRVEFDATTQDGSRLIVTRPEHDWTYSDFRVFYGTGGRVVERELVRASRGNSTWIVFQLDGAENTAIFPWSGSGSTQPATLAAMGQVPQELMVGDADAGASNVTFFCR